jgi:hypothetical protein
MLDQDAQNRTAGKTSQNRTEKTRTAGTGLPGKDSQDRKGSRDIDS